MKRNPVLLLRGVALVEGVSFLLLLFVAMPLKYFANLPLAVSIVGMAHGILFLLVCAMLWQVHRIAQWRLRRSALVLLSALLPGGPFLIDRHMLRYAAEYSRNRPPPAHSL